MSDNTWPVVGQWKLVGQGSLNEWRQILGRCGWVCQILRKLVVYDVDIRRKSVNGNAKLSHCAENGLPLRQ
jgi:hypothetical protein